MSEADRPFIEAILAAPEDAAPLLIYADWLEERGRSDLAYACRWMGYRGYRPGERRRPRRRKPWAWWPARYREAEAVEADPEDQKDVVRCPHAWLPPLLFLATAGAYVPHAYFLTWRQAADALAFGLRHLRELTSLEPPPIV